MKKPEYAVGFRETLVEVLERTGWLISTATLKKAAKNTRDDLNTVVGVMSDDEEFLLDVEPKKILVKNIKAWVEMTGVGVELIGEGFGSEGTLIGSNSRLIVHVDVVDGTRETTHFVGCSYFEAGVMDWSESPRLNDSFRGIAYQIGHHPIYGNGIVYRAHTGGPSTRHSGQSGHRIRLQPSGSIDFNDRGFFDCITSFRGTGVLAVLKDRMLEALYGATPQPDVFHRETLTSCGEILNVANGSVRGVMDLRPAVGFIAERLGIPGYSSPTGLCMHPYDVSGAYPIIRGTDARIEFYDKHLNVVEPSQIEIRNTGMDIGYICCANQALMNKIQWALKKVLNL